MAFFHLINHKVQCTCHYVIPKSSVHAFTSFPKFRVHAFSSFTKSNACTFTSFWVLLFLLLKGSFVKNVLKWPSIVKPVLPISMLYSFLDIFFINICAKDLCGNVFNKHQFCFKTMFLNVWKRWYTMNECLKSEKNVKRWLIKHFPFVFVFCYLLLLFPSNH